jgi:SAM-dependent methyltransferase
VAKRYESESEQGYQYPAARVESLGKDEPKLKRYHSESFIDWINNHLSLVKAGEKVLILDIGSGAGLYAEQLRSIFGNKIEVYTTGLRKKAANKLRTHINNQNVFFTFKSNNGVSPKIHQNDLKWRSILELSDFPEFDLAIDTVGEFSYLEDLDSSLKRYVVALLHKLKVGGHASISIGSALEVDSARLVLDEIKEDPVYQHSFEYSFWSTDLPTGAKEGERHEVLKIDKVTDLNV